MNKKFLSAILFGALMVTSTGTFVSCKDYDDDIDEINKELSDLKSQLSALQTKVDAGKYVTGVATTANGITITLNDGSSYPITNGKDGAPGAAGKDGDKIDINEDGYFVLNDKVTEWKAVTKDELGQTVKVKTPTVSEDGCWVFYNEKGEAQPTTIKVAPVTAVQNADKTWTLTVYAADGKSQEIIVPTAASSVTDLMLITRINGSSSDDDKAALKIAQYDFAYNKNDYSTAPDRDKWAGQRALPEDGYIMAGTSNLKIQINPTSVDAADLSLKLVDSKNNYVSGVDLVTSAYTGLEYFSRAANANGMYNLGVANKYIKKTTTDNELNNYWKQFDYYVGGSKLGNKAYAVTAGGDVRSKYEVAISKGDAQELKSLYLFDASYNYVEFVNGNTKADLTGDSKGIYLDKKAIATGKEDKADAKLNPNVWYYLGTEASHAFYDAHLVFSADDKTLFGIETKEENGVIAIRLTKTPDNITKAAFLLTIQNVDNKGVYNEAKVWIGETSVINNEVVYDAITHQLSKNNTNKSKDKNFFQISLAKMKEALGTEGLALWNTKVKRADVAYYNADGVAIAEDSQIAETFVSELKDNMKGNGDKDVTVGRSATNMIFAIDNVATASKFEIGKQYTAVITFYDAITDGEVLNTIKVPFTFTLPAITTLFQIDPGFVKDGVANCYLYADDATAVHKDKSATFKLSRIFSKFDPNGFTLSLDNKTPIVGDDTSAKLAHINSTTSETKNKTSLEVKPDVLDYVTLNGDLGKEKGYDKALKMTISGKFDNAWEYPSDAVFNFEAKIMSPIEKGKIVPKEGNVVKIKASALDGYKFGNDVILGYTYNSEVTYKVMPDKVVEDGANAWTRNDIKAVSGETGNKLYFTVENGGNATAATKELDKDGKETGAIVDGGLTLKGYQVDHTVDTTIKIKVTDIWNRVKASDVPVQITVGE